MRDLLTTTRDAVPVRSGAPANLHETAAQPAPDVESGTPAPRRRWGLVAACVTYPILTTGLYLSVFPLWVLPWMTEFHVSRTTIMAVFVTGIVVTTFVTPIVGKIVDMLSPRTTTIIGAVMLGVGFELIAVAKNFWLVALLFASVLGLGSAMSGLLPAQTVALRTVPEKAGFIGGLMVLSLSVGGGILPLVVMPALNAVGWRATFAACGLLVAGIVVPTAWIFLDGNRVAKQSRGPSGAPSTSIKAVITDGRFWSIVGGLFPLALVTTGIAPNMMPIAIDSGLSANMAAYALSAMAFAGGIGGMVVGGLADRLDPRLVFGGLAALVSASMLALTGGRYMLIPAMSLMGFASAGGMPLLGVLILRSFSPAEFPRVQGMIIPLLAPAFVSPMLVSYSFEHTGHYTTAFVAMAILLIGAIFSISRLKLSR